MKRRDFLRFGGSLGLSLTPPRNGWALPRSLASSSRSSQQSAASAPSSPLGRGDLAIVNARVITVEPTQPAAQAVLVRGGRIAHVGSSAEVKAKANGIRQFDAGGRAVVPGFVDAHTHVEVAVSHQTYAVDVHVPPCSSIPDIVAALKAKAAQTPPGQWVIGRSGFGLQNSLPERRLPIRQELDEASRNHPIIIFSGRHISMLNTPGLEAIGMWDAATARPPRGTTIHRDPAGVPTGLATEVFYFLPDFSVEQMKVAMRQHAKALVTANGTTTIYSIPFSANDVRADIELQRSGELPVRIRMFYHVPHMTSLEGLLNMGYPSGMGDDLFRFGGMKLFIDGIGSDALGNRFDDLKWTQSELNQMLARADAAGVQTIMHMVTDGGLRMATAAIEHVRRLNPRQPFLIHRMEHGADRGDLEAIAHLRNLGVRISITPGPGRPGATRPRYRTLVRQQFDPVLITDTTGTTTDSPNILQKIAYAATAVDDGGGAPRGEELGFDEALRLFTLGNARAGYEDHDKGSIAAGKLGDFAVLSGDPHAASPRDLLNMKVDATILGGDVVFQR